MSLFRIEKRLMSTFRISYFPHSNAVLIYGTLALCQSCSCLHNAGLFPNNARLFPNNARLFPNNAGLLETPKRPPEKTFKILKNNWLNVCVCQIFFVTLQRKR